MDQKRDSLQENHPDFNAQESLAQNRFDTERASMHNKQYGQGNVRHTHEYNRSNLNEGSHERNPSF
jgi:hypothetical protein